MSSTPSTTAPGPARSAPAGPEAERMPRPTPLPPAESRAAFEEALARLQRRKGDAGDAGTEALAPDPALAGQPSPLPAALAPAAGEGMALAALDAAASASPAVGSTLGADELAGMLRSLHVPASTEGPQRWEFHFGAESHLVQGLTLTGQPGSTLTVHLHAQPQLSARERELSAQRLGELRQRLGERGSPVEALHWQDGSDAEAEPGPRR